MDLDEVRSAIDGVSWVTVPDFISQSAGGPVEMRR
jgi:hypothetical protein